MLETSIEITLVNKQYNMKWIAEIKNPIPRRFVIENVTLRNEARDLDIPGFYLYVYDGDLCTHDYLQDTLQIAINLAFDEYNVPKDAWKTID
jgi:hypothetical protein